MPVKIDDVLCKRYRVEEILGHGGMADVYLVYDMLASAPFALKLLREDLAEDVVFFRRFKREAQTLAKLQHPSIVRFYALEENAGMVFIIMDYVDGTTLRKELFKRKQPFTLDEIITILRPVCAALNYAHTKQMVHCDVKPANIMIEKTGRVLLTDFGIARISEGATTATMAGAGTPAYMAPEQILGKDPIPQSDIYALGIVLYEMLTGGERPFTGEIKNTTGSTGEKVRWEQLHMLPPSPRKYNKAISPEVEAVVMKCLEKDPSKRYKSAMEFLNALQSADVKKLAVKPPPLVRIPPKPVLVPPKLKPVLQRAEEVKPPAPPRLRPELQRPKKVVAPAVPKTPVQQVAKPAYRKTWPVQLIVAIVALGILMVAAAAFLITSLKNKGIPANLLSMPTQTTVIPTTEAPAAVVSATAIPATKPQLEVYSWLSNDDAGQAALLKLFKEKYPDIELIDAGVAGNNSSEAVTTLATRFAVDDPPDTFFLSSSQQWIDTYVQAGQIETLDDLYKTNGWTDALPKTLVSLLTHNGHLYSIPLATHRTNVLWYNPRVLAKYNVAAPGPANFQSWLDAMADLKNAGMATPLIIGEQWSTVELYETVLLATVGPQTYTDLLNGKADWASDGVKKSITNFEKVLAYANTDYDVLTWQEASKRVIDGKAAFMVMGDWVEYYFRSDLALTPDSDYAWMAVPGTQGSYDFLYDGFVLPVGARDRDAAVKWLTFIGSKEGQDACNSQNIDDPSPVRLDADKSLYSVYVQSAMDDWASDTVVGSLIFGGVVNNDWHDEIGNAIYLYLADHDAASLQTNFVSSCATIGACGKTTEIPAQPTVIFPTKVPSVQQQLDVFSAFTGGGDDGIAFNELIQLWNQEYPNIGFVNSASDNEDLATRLAAGDIPDSFQGHAGQELNGTYVKAGQLEPLDDLYAANGWYDVFPAKLISLISQDGHPYSVPVNIHRTNLLWYNPKVLAKYHVVAPDPANFQSWLDAMAALKKAGMPTPLALSEQWTVVQLYETVLLATVGPQTYTDLWNGKADWSSEGVKQSITNFKKVISYANSDNTTLNWQDAAARVANGDAAFYVMGDWAEVYFRVDLALTPKTDYAWMAVPGTDGTYDFLSDSFVLPVNAKNRDAAIEWLTLIGSKEGQDAFNPLKGSISVRNDADKSLYGIYQRSAMADWATDTVVGSLEHGIVANTTWVSEINNAFNEYLTDLNSTKLQEALVKSCTDVGACSK